MGQAARLSPAPGVREVASRAEVAALLAEAGVDLGPPHPGSSIDADHRNNTRTCSCAGLLLVLVFLTPSAPLGSLGQVRARGLEAQVEGGALAPVTPPAEGQSCDLN